MFLDYKQVNHLFIVCGKTNLRKGIDGLASIVQHEYQLDMYDNALFLFLWVDKIVSKCCITTKMVFFFCISDWIKENYDSQEQKKKFVGTHTNRFVGY